jgi:hypothetical protein
MPGATITTPVGISTAFGVTNNSGTAIYGESANFYGVRGQSTTNLPRVGPPAQGCSARRMARMELVYGERRPPAQAQTGFGALVLTVTVCMAIAQVTGV